MKNYDKKVKQTRILLADYLLLKSIAQRAGVSMSEALHKIISQEISRAEPREVVTQILTPVTAAMPAIVVAGVIPSQVAAGVMPRRVTTRIAPINPIIKLRVTVAKGGSTNGRAKQQV